MEQPGPEIRTRTLPDGVAIEAIDTASESRGSWMLIVLFSLPFAGVGGYQVYAGAAQVAGGSYFGIAQLLFGLPFLGIGLLVMGVGVMARWGTWEIVVSRGRLTRVFRLGKLRWSKSIAIEDVETLEVADGAAAELKEGEERGSSMRDVELRAVRRSGEAPFGLVWGGVKKLERIRRVAVLVGEAIGQRGMVVDTAVAAARSASGGGDGSRGWEPEAVPELPVGSRVTLSETADGLTVMLPKMGLRKGGKGMFLFAIVWNLIAWGVTGGFVVATIQSPQWMLLFPLAIGSFFILIGGVMAWAAISRGTRRAIVDVVGDALMITQQTAFGETVDQWEGTVRAVRVEPSGETMNDVAILHLAVEAEGREKKGLFKERPDDELRWLAAVLRNALGVGAGKS